MTECVHANSSALEVSGDAGQLYRKLVLDEARPPLG